MKKLFILCLTLFSVSNSYAYDLSSLVGEWTREVDGKTDMVTIELKEGVLHVKGAFAFFGPDDYLKDFQILNEGTVVIHDLVPVSFSSGTIDSETLIITVHLHTSSVEEWDDVPDFFYSLALKPLKDSNQLRYQFGGMGFSSVDGLTPGRVQTAIFDRQ